MSRAKLPLVLFVLTVISAALQFASLALNFWLFLMIQPLIAFSANRILRLNGFTRESCIHFSAGEITFVPSAAISAFVVLVFNRT